MRVRSIVTSLLAGVATISALPACGPAAQDGAASSSSAGTVTVPSGTQTPSPSIAARATDPKVVAALGQAGADEAMAAAAAVGERVAPQDVVLGKVKGNDTISGMTGLLDAGLVTRLRDRPAVRDSLVYGNLPFTAKAMRTPVVRVGQASLPGSVPGATVKVPVDVYVPLTAEGHGETVVKRSLVLFLAPHGAGNRSWQVVTFQAAQADAYDVALPRP